MRKLNEFLGYSSGISFLIYLIIHGVPHCRSDCKHVYVNTGNYLDYLVSENMVLADDLYHVLCISLYGLRISLCLTLLRGPLL